jgi:hypothetical protein
MKSICFPPSAFCLPLAADCLLPTAQCIWGESQLAGLLPGCAIYDKMSSPVGKEETSNFKN